MKNRKVIAAYLLVCLLALPKASQAGVIITHSDAEIPHLPQILKDKKGNIYIFDDKYDLRHGVASFEYVLINKNNPKILLSLYEGETYGDGETCPDKEAASDIIIEKATISQKYFIKDLNKDGIKDIILQFEEMDCKTNMISKITKNIIATKNGFKINSIEEK